MSKKKKVLVVAGVLVAVGAVAAISAPGHRGGHGGFGGGMGDSWLMGQDGGMRGMGGPFGRWGKVSRDSFDTRVREIFARVDANSDGVVDKAEIEAALKTMGERRGRWGRGRHGENAGGPGGGMAGRFLRGFDTDRDGKVTKDEYLTEVRRRFGLMDLDGDGKITDADLPPMMRGRNVLKGGEGGGRMGGGGFMIGMLRQADADKDGVVTLQEVVTAAEARFARFDHNKDATLDAADRDALVTETRDYRVQRILHRFGATKDGKISRDQAFKVAGEMFQRMDTDGDGVISRGERGGRAMHRGHGGGRHERGGWGRGPGSGSDTPADTQKKE